MAVNNYSQNYKQQNNIYDFVAIGVRTVAAGCALAAPERIEQICEGRMPE